MLVRLSEGAWLTFDEDLQNQDVRKLKPVIWFRMYAQALLLLLPLRVCTGAALGS